MLESLTRINGRMGRLHWWLTQIAVAVIGFFSNLFLAPPAPDWLARGSGDPTQDMRAAFDLMAQTYTDPVLLVFFLIQQWLFVSSTVQRRHDRNKQGISVYLGYVFLGLMVMGMYGVAYKDMLVGGTIALLIGALAMAVLGIWIFITCGLLPGDNDINDYGDPPGLDARNASFGREIDAIRRAGDVRARARDFDPEPQPVAVVNTSSSPASYGATSARPTFGRR